MTVGLLTPTSGEAYISGYSVTREHEMVQKVLGLCPQFDLLYDDLTVAEHLLFYARLKGYPPEIEKEHVQDLMKEIGLTGKEFIFSSGFT